MESYILLFVIHVYILNFIDSYNNILYSKKCKRMYNNFNYLYSIKFSIYFGCFYM